MGNTFIEPKNIARRAMDALKANLVAAKLVHRDFTEVATAKGGVVDVQVPNSFVASDFDDTVGIVPQGIQESSIPLRIDQIADISVEVTSKEQTLSIESLDRQIIMPGMQGMAEFIDGKVLLGLKNASSQFTGTAGSVPSSSAAWSSARRKLNDARASVLNRYAIWNTAADEKLSDLDELKNAEKSGSTEALREASMGRVKGFENYMSQLLPDHVAGTFRATGTIAATGTKGTKSITLTSSSNTNTGTVKHGDLLTIGGDQYVADLSAVAGGSIAAVAGVVTVPLATALLADYAAAVTTIVADHACNLLFHKNAFGLIVRPLDLPLDGRKAYVTTDPDSGLSLRVVYGFDQTKKKNILSIDALFGFAAFQHRHIVRVLG